MSVDEALGSVMRLGAATEGLAALAALLRADVEQIELDRDIEVGLDGVIAALGVDLGELNAVQRRRVAMTARSQIVPARPPGGARGYPAGRYVADVTVPRGPIASLAIGLEGYRFATGSRRSVPTPSSRSTTTRSRRRTAPRARHRTQARRGRCSARSWRRWP